MQFAMAHPFLTFFLLLAVLETIGRVARASACAYRTKKLGSCCKSDPTDKVVLMGGSEEE
jgi:hypothetical protein